WQARLFATGVRLCGAGVSARRRAARLPRRASSRGAGVRPAPARDQRVPLARGPRADGQARRRHAAGLPPAALDHPGLRLLGGVGPRTARATRLRRPGPTGRFHRALTDGPGHSTLDRRSTLLTRWTMERRLGALAALFLALLVPGCGGRNVLLPPRLDLRPYAKLGLVTFSVENARGSLQRYATEQFAEQVLAAQPGIELLELGSV